MKLTAVDHPLIMPVFSGVIMEAYSRIGIRVQFELVSGGRGLVESSSGRLDGELARLSIVEQVSDTLIRIPVGLGKVRVFLYCREGIACNRDVLNNRKTIVGVVSGDNGMSQYMANKQASTFAIPNLDKLGEMLEKERLNYVLGLEHETGVQSVHVKQFHSKSEPLLEDEVFHYIHQKHLPLVPMLTASLKESLKDNPLSVKAKN